VLGCEDYILRLWDLSSGVCFSVFEGHTGWVEGAKLLEGNRALSWAGDSTLRLWDLRSGVCLSVFEGHTDRINGIELLEDNRVLSWAGDKTLRLWDLTGDKCTYKHSEHAGEIKGIHLLEGNRALSWARDKTLRLWDLSSGVCLSVFEGHTGCVEGVKLLEGNRVLSWADDSTLRLWDLSSGKCLFKVASLLGDSHLMSDLIQRRGERWRKSYLPSKNTITVYQGNETIQVRWHGNQPVIKKITDDGSWLVINASKEIKVLHPWQGNKLGNLSDLSDDIPNEV